MPYCNQCGGEVGEGDQFCTHCGVARNYSSASSGLTSVAQQPRGQRGKRFLKWGGIGCGTLILVIVLVGVISAIVAPSVDYEKASEPGAGQQIAEIEDLNETVVFDHSQGENVFFVYVPEQTVGSDMDF